MKAIIIEGYGATDELSEIARLIDSGKLKSKVATIFSLENAQEAQALSQKGGAPGKIVIKI